MEDWKEKLKQLGGLPESLEKIEEEKPKSILSQQQDLRIEIDKKRSEDC